MFSIVSPRSPSSLRIIGAATIFIHFNTLTLFFPAILAIHNWEEYRRYENFAETYHSKLHSRLTQPRVVAAAAVLLTLAATALVSVNYLHGTQSLRIICRIAVFTFMFNAFGHCVLSIQRRKPVPGAFSAIACILPFSALAVYTMHVNLGDTFPSLAKYAVAGALALPPTVFVSLLCGLAYSHATGKQVQDGHTSAR